MGLTGNVFCVPIQKQFLRWMFLTVVVAYCPIGLGQDDLSDSGIDNGLDDLPLRSFLPDERLEVESTELTAASFPVVDVHTHFYLRTKHNTAQLDELVALMDRNNIQVCVSLDGRLGDRLPEHADFLFAKYKDRFAIFTNTNWKGNGKDEQPRTWDCQRDDFARSTVLALTEAKDKYRISGVKVFKSFGLTYRNGDGSLIAVDDPRFDPIWRACGELGLPVIMHTADPSAFFEPITPNNERIEELTRHPEWHFPLGQFPSRQHLHQARENLFRRHRATTFIAAHFGNDAEDLKQTARMLEEHPNVVVEFASRISELGRQPYTARDFLIKYQDRVLFGTDGPWPEQRYQYYWRFLETRDEYFPYSEKPFPPQGLWRIYGVHLPPQVLQKIYYKNAGRIVPGISQRLEKLK